MAFVGAGAIVPMTRRRAVAVAGAVLRRLRGGYGCAAVEAPWVPTRPTRPPPPCHAPWTGRGVASTPSALSSSALAATAPDPAPAAGEERGGSPIAETGAETCSARFARWTRNRARALRVSPSARWRLSAEEQTEDVAVARAILREAREAGAYDPSRRAHPRDAAADVARAFIALTTLASHPDAGWRCETKEDARAVAALFRDVRDLIPRHLERDVDLVRCVDAFRHAGVWDIARDAERALRERAEEGEEGEEAYRDDDPENRTDPSRVLEALGAAAGAAFALMRLARGLGGASRAHNWGTGGGDSAARLYDAETWRGSKGRETRETTRSTRLHKNETGVDGRVTYRAWFGDGVPKNAPPPEERLRRATMWTKTLSEFVKSESMTPSHAGSSRSSHVVPTDDAATEMLFQNLAMWADVSTRALHGDRAAYLVARRAGSDARARRRRRKGRGEAGEEDVSSVRERKEGDGDDGEDEETEETTDAFEDDFEDDELAELERPRSLAARRRAQYRGLRHALRHMRALAEAHARDPDANARAMPPPLEIALVVNAFLRARAPASGASGSATGVPKGADADDARAANRHMADFEACADALALWRLALDASGSEEGAYREKYFPHQVWARDEHHEREVFNPAAEKFRKQMRELVDAAGENARENVRLTLSGRKKTNGDGTVDASAAALRASTSALRALTTLAQRGIPTRRLAFDRVAAAALDAAERMCTAGGSEVEVADAAATALRAYQIASEREHEGRIRDAPVRRWCRLAEKAVVALEKNAGNIRPETLGVLVAAAGAFAGRETLAGDVGALLAVADDAVAAKKTLPGSFAASASAHDAQRVLVGWRRAKEADAEALRANRIRFAPTPAALLAVLRAAARALRDELDPQTVHDIVAGADAVEREVLAAEADADADLAARLAEARSALAEAKKEARARRQARDAAHVAASRLCLQGLRAMDEPAPPPDLAREAARASEATAAAAADLEGAMIAKCARAWARLVRGARVFPDPAAVAATLAALPEARPPASTADLRMIERAVLDVETARASAEPRPFPSKGKNPPTGIADCEGPFQTKTKEETLDAYVRRWLDASPAKARAALEASLATADAGAGGSKAGALVAAARADTTKRRAKLREAILAAFEGEKGW